MTKIVVVDVGNFSSKYAYQDKGEIKANSFSSILHRYKELDEKSPDMSRVTYGNFDYYIGEGVKNFYFGRSEQMYFGNTRKGHHEAQIRLVYALYNIYKECGENEFNLVLTCPYESMEEDKSYFVDKFEGERTAIIDGETFDFKVNKILMAAEGLGAYYLSSSPNCAIVDAGSMTLNILYLINGVISRNDSHTINGGTLYNDMNQLSDTFAKTCPNIQYDYPIICTGGKSEGMKQALDEIGYSNVSSSKIENYPDFYINSVGLLLKYGKKFEGIFE